MKLTTRMIIGASLLFSATTLAQESIMVGVSDLPLTNRKALIQRSSNKTPALTFAPTIAAGYQRNTFDAVIDVSFLGENLTVGDAMRKLSGFIGYELYSGGKAIDAAAVKIFNMPLPDAHRRFTHTSVRNVMVAVLGPGHTLVVDHKLRAISADLSPVHQRFSRIER